MYLKPSAWQALGLSVGASYTLLGAFALVFPGTAASTFFHLGTAPALWPYNDTSNGTGKGTPVQGGGGGGNVSAGEDGAVRILMPLLGARDIAIAAAIFAFDYREQYNAVGTVILAGMGLCAADVAAIWTRRGAGLGSLFLAGATQWGLIGWGLLFWY